MKRKYLLLIILFLCIFNMDVFAANYKDPNNTSQNLNVLVIEINPVLNSITDHVLYPRNNGHPKVSDWFGHNVEASIYEIKQDIEESSHGLVKVNIKREYLNEFPTYNKSLLLSNGTSSKRYDEDTYIRMSRIDSSNKGDWYHMISTQEFNQVNKHGAGNFNYDYIIQKFNLIERRNRKEFDQVWLFIISPIGANESIMVGKNSYWINGNPIEYNCDNFAIMGFEIARRDSMFHSFGHLAEQVFKRVFGQTKDIYGQGVYGVNSKQAYQNLNLWEKFALTSYNNNSNYSSVGNTHFPYNASKGYEYSNKNKVKTNWREWLNYPNVPGDSFVYANSDDYLNYSLNRPILSSSTQNKSEDRLYQRFWFSLLPHISGYTSDGYLNNWWNYWCTLDYVTSIKTNGSTDISTSVGSIIEVNYTVIYNSLTNIVYNRISSGNNVKIENNKILGFKDGVLYAKGVGKSSVTVYYDGKFVTYNVKVYSGSKPKPTAVPTPSPKPTSTPKPTSSATPKPSSNPTPTSTPGSVTPTKKPDSGNEVTPTSSPKTSENNGLVVNTGDKESFAIMVLGGALAVLFLIELIIVASEKGKK